MRNKTSGLCIFEEELTKEQVEILNEHIKTLPFYFLTLKGIRVAKNLTLEDAAKKANITITKLYRIENGKTECKFSDLKMLASIYDLTIHEIVDIYERSYKKCI